MPRWKFLNEARMFALKLELFLLIAGFALLHLRGEAYRHWVFGCICFLAIALAFPSLLQPLRRVLQKVSKAWGKAVTFFILGVVYFLALVPLGLLARVFRKEFLSLRLDPKASTYWIQREKKDAEKTAGERQY